MCRKAQRSKIIAHMSGIMSCSCVTVQLCSITYKEIHAIMNAAYTLLTLTSMCLIKPLHFLQAVWTTPMQSLLGP